MARSHRTSLHAHDAKGPTLGAFRIGPQVWVGKSSVAALVLMAGYISYHP